MLTKKKNRQNDMENFSAEKMSLLQEEYADYIQKTVTTLQERKVLKAWISQGHSIYESGGSRYVCDPYPPLDYLETYRMDKRIEQELEGKTPEEQEKYLREYMGYDAPDQEEPPSETPAERIHCLEHDLFYLWEYIASVGLDKEAEMYLESCKEYPIPFEYNG